MSLDPLAWLAQAAADTKPAPVHRRVSEDTDEASRWAWTNTAACRHANPAIFYPVESEPYDTATLDAARRICNACPVFTACHDHALHNEADGIWAGTAPTERRRLRRTLHIVDPAAIGRDGVHDEAVGITPPCGRSTPGAQPVKPPQPQA